MAAAVIDLGTHMIKAGMTGDMEPRVLFPPLVSREQGKVVVGEAGGVCVINGGVVTNWGDMEEIYRHVYAKLGVASSAQPLVLTISDNDKHDVMKTAEILFKLGVPSLFVGHPGVLSLYAVGSLNGLMVQTGESLTQIVPIIDGYALKEKSTTMAVNGSDLTSYLKELLVAKGESFTKDAKMEVYKDMKERLCYVALDPDEEGDGTDGQNVYKLPDSSVISLEKERYRCSEALFDPTLVGKDGPGLCEAIHQCINETNVPAKLYSNIILSGGNANLPGLSRRVQREITKLAGQIEVNVTVSGSPKYSAFIGGSIFGSLAQLKDYLVDKKKMDTYGLSAFAVEKPN